MTKKVDMYFYNPKKIILQEDNERGFLSNYTTILMSFKGLIKYEGIDHRDILISSSMFSLYGHPKYWFDSSKIMEKKSYVVGDIYRSSTEYFDFDAWPTKEQLNLLEYTNYFSYNDKVKKYLKLNLPKIENGFGIHFRGTDHSYHVDEVPLENYFQTIKNNFNEDEYETVFICSDEYYVIEKFEKFFKSTFNFSNIKINNVTRSKTKTALHLSNFDARTKVKMGYEVLLDSHSLSSCKTIIGKSSNVISYARILNPEIKVLYQDKNLTFKNLPIGKHKIVL